MITIDTGDTVFHRPTREWWRVAYVRDGRIAWFGWPPGEAHVADCLLVTKATPEERRKDLESLAQMRNSSDPRCVYAKARLREMQDEQPQESAA